MRYPDCVFPYGMSSPFSLPINHLLHMSHRLLTTDRYIFMTGSTGLLGSYLVRDLLLSGRRLALLVRRDRKHSPRSRVEKFLSHWEDLLGIRLPRPVVLEGNLSEPLCGLDEASCNWIRRNCDQVLNNAASLTFRASDRDADPWLTNVTGTTNVLELAGKTGLKHLHHVSTAYTCGLRSGRILESELDVGQEFGNDYEKSKVESEGLVRSADHLQTVTIYRPSIIVGDSQTGYTSTYHGFFAALRLGHTLLTRVVKGSTNSPALMGLLGVDLQAQKNFVPVDWVASVIVDVMQTPTAHGKTFHLTHPAPLSMNTVGCLVQEAVNCFSQDASPDDPDLCDEQWFADNLRTQLDVYTSYYRNDPTFDQTNTLQFASHIPCPTLDTPTMLRMARLAIENDFGRQAAPKQKPVFDVETFFGPSLSLDPDGDALSLSDSTNSVDQPSRLGLEIAGAGGGQWTLYGCNDQLLAVVPGIDARAGSVCRLNTHTFQKLIARSIDLDVAFNAGSILVDTTPDNHSASPTRGTRIPQEKLKALLHAAVLKNNTQANPAAWPPSEEAVMAGTIDGPAD